MGRVWGLWFRKTTLELLVMYDCGIEIRIFLSTQIRKSEIHQYPDGKLIGFFTTWILPERICSRTISPCHRAERRRCRHTYEPTPQRDESENRIEREIQREMGMSERGDKLPTWSKRWESWRGRQWGQRVRQQSKQKIFFSFFLAWGWRWQGEKNFSDKRKKIHEEFIVEWGLRRAKGGGRRRKAEGGTGGSVLRGKSNNRDLWERQMNVEAEVGVGACDCVLSGVFM